MTEDPEKIDKEFEETLQAFYANLLAKQKPGDPVLDKVLYENIWDLYSYTEEDHGRSKDNPTG